MASTFPMKKNAVVRIVFPIYDNDGDLVTAAAALDSEYSLDGAGFSDCSNEATEIGATGMYYLDLDAGETNGDVVTIQVKTSTTDAKTTVLVFYTAAQTLDELDVVADGIKGKTDSLAFTGGNVHAHTKVEDNIDFGATKKASINTEVDNALDTAVPGTPTADSINERVANIDDNPNSYKADVSSVALEATVSDLITRTKGLDDIHDDLVVVLQHIGNRLKVNVASSQLELYNDAGDTIIKTWPLTDKDGNSITAGVGTPTEREQPV